MMIRVCVVLVFLGLVAASSEETTAKQPRVLTFVAPAYPVLARKARVQGPALIDLKIRADGTVESAQVKQAWPMFGAYATKALEKWRFEPMESPTNLTVTVRFELEGCDLPEQGFSETRVTANFPNEVQVATNAECTVTMTPKKK